VRKRARESAAAQGNDYARRPTSYKSSLSSVRARARAPRARASGARALCVSEAGLKFLRRVHPSGAHNVHLPPRDAPLSGPPQIRGASAASGSPRAAPGSGLDARGTGFILLECILCCSIPTRCRPSLRDMCRHFGHRFIHRRHMRHSHATPHAAPGQGGAHTLPRRPLRDAAKVASMSDSETLRRKLRTDVDISDLRTKGKFRAPPTRRGSPARNRDKGTWPKPPHVESCGRGADLKLPRALWSRPTPMPSPSCGGRAGGGAGSAHECRAPLQSRCVARLHTGCICRPARGVHLPPCKRGAFAALQGGCSQRTGLMVCIRSSPRGRPPGRASGAAPASPASGVAPPAANLNESLCPCAGGVSNARGELMPEKEPGAARSR